MVVRAHARAADRAVLADVVGGAVAVDDLAAAAAARARRVHLIRGLAYAAPGVAGWSLLALVGVGAGVQIAIALPSWLSGLVGLLGTAFVLVMASYHVLWWYLFIRCYLRLRHAALTVVLFAGMSVLVLVTATLYYQTRGRWW